MKKILVVGGTFDNNGGKNSTFIDKLFEGKLNSYDKLINGGNFKDLMKILLDTINYDIVFWLPNVSNDKEKIRNVKEVNPKCILITSKRNDNDKYNWREILKKALTVKSNLMLVLKKKNNIINTIVIDPLGYAYHSETANIKFLSNQLFDRIDFLLGVKRVETYKSRLKNNNLSMIPIEFITLVKEYGNLFEELLKDIAQTERYLGNCSYRTRCSYGFPSYYNRKDNKIFVSKRNVNKVFLSKNDFVEVYKKNDLIYYKGENKPSVDTPIQLELYFMLPQVNYMIHSHCYLKDAFWTNTQYPCGALNEVEEIMSSIKTNKIESENLIKINLIGHGSLVMANDIKNLYNLEYYNREIPEIKGRTLIK